LTKVEVNTALVDAFRAGAFSELKTLSLTNNWGICDDGATSLAAVLRFAPCLTNLDLKGTSIYGQGCGAIAYAIVSHCPALTRLVFPIGTGGADVVKGIISAMNQEERHDKEMKFHVRQRQRKKREKKK
jgi:hypothetical protein